MTMFPTPEQEARSIREGLEFAIRVRESRIALLEKLIQKYATRAKAYDRFTDEEWTEIRCIVGKTE